jgi:hypothetical protein
MEPVRLEALPPLARGMAVESIEWMERAGDTALWLLNYPARFGQYAHFDAARQKFHPIRESAWWATGLLLRNRGDDAARAEKILEAVLAWQFVEPGMGYHGTFIRAPEEPRPAGKDAVMWRDYDPNWRQFIGTTFVVLLKMLPNRLSRELTQKLEASVKLAVEGEPPDRFTAHYTNIAMMHAILLVYAGGRFGREDWTQRGVALAREIYELFAPNRAYAEYNSPTYYGVDLYALRLWRLLSPRPELVEWGAAMERDLWRDIADYYHPRLRNICGPYDRSYGMDMTYYAAGVGMFFRLELPTNVAPFPDTTREFDHAHDFTLAPLVAMLGADIPSEARTMLQAPITERFVEHAIEDERVATAFLGREWMWGGEREAKKCGWPQVHLATAHWLQPDGSVGWFRLENGMYVDVTATASGLQLRANNGEDAQKLTWHFSSKPQASAEEWKLPGMTVRLKGGRVDWAVDESGLALFHTMAPHATLALDLEFAPDIRSA